VGKREKGRGRGTGGVREEWGKQVGGWEDRIGNKRGRGARASGGGGGGVRREKQKEIKGQEGG